MEVRKARLTFTHDHLCHWQGGTPGTQHTYTYDTGFVKETLGTTKIPFSGSVFECGIARCTPAACQPLFCLDGDYLNQSLELLCRVGIRLVENLRDC